MSTPLPRPVAKAAQHVSRWVIFYRATAVYVVVALTVIIGLLLDRGG